MHRSLFGLLALLFLAAFAPPSGQTSPEAQVSAALMRWTEAFNAGDADAVCRLFASDLRYDYPGFPERGYAEICNLLNRSLADRSKRYTYALDVKEIIVSGDLAVVRLVWTLEIRQSGSTADPVRSVEPGMDIFRRQPDGSWKIVRYIAYEEP